MNEITIDLMIGTYRLSPFTNVDPDEIGIDVSTYGGEHIGSIIGESIADEDDDEGWKKFKNMVENWIVDNEC